MAISEKDYRYRANQLLSLDFQDATPRITGFIEWLESDATGRAVLQELRERDVQPLIQQAGYQHPPDAKTPDDVAAIALLIIDSAVKGKADILQTGMTLGIRSYSSKLQDSFDEISRRYLRVLWQVLERRLFEDRARSPALPSPAPSATHPKDVFVVHGRNETFRRAMFSFLRSIGLHPIEWEKALELTKKGAPYVGEVLDAAFARAGAVVVLLTPDDEARLKPEFLKPTDGPEEKNLTGQARANVLFEAGMAFGRHQDKTVLVQIGEIRPFSDIGGRHVVHLTNSFKSRQALLNRLRTVGCDVDPVGSDWHEEGDFAITVSAEGSSPDERFPSGSAAMPNLSREARTLLRHAIHDPAGGIICMEVGEGALMVQTNDKSFVDTADPRSRATWEAVLQELENGHCIAADGADREYFKVTRRGYEVGEMLIREAGPLEQRHVR